MTDITENAELITERRKVYGDPEETFGRIAAVWSGILGHHVNPVEVPLMMAGMKLVRTQVCPDYSDNSDDIDGYMDIFRLLVGSDMVQARSVIEYLEKKLPKATESQTVKVCTCNGPRISDTLTCPVHKGLIPGF